MLKDRYADGDRYRLCLLRRPIRRDNGVWNYDNVTIDSGTEWGLKHSFTIDWYVDSTDTVPFTPKVNTQTHFVFSKCAAARRRAMCEIHMYGQRTFGAVPILNLSLGAPKCDHV